MMLLRLVLMAAYMTTGVSFYSAYDRGQTHEMIFFGFVTVFLLFIRQEIIWETTNPRGTKP